MEVHRMDASGWTVTLKEIKGDYWKQTAATILIRNASREFETGSEPSGGTLCMLGT